MKVSRIRDEFITDPQYGSTGGYYYFSAFSLLFVRNLCLTSFQFMFCVRFRMLNFFWLFNIPSTCTGAVCFFLSVKNHSVRVMRNRKSAYFLIFPISKAERCQTFFLRAGPLSSTLCPVAQSLFRRVVLRSRALSAQYDS
jgi:hypothetical protein